MTERRRLRGKKLLVAGASLAAISFVGCGPEEMPPGNLVAPIEEAPPGNLVAPPPPPPEDPGPIGNLVAPPPEEVPPPQPVGPAVPVEE